MTYTRRYRRDARLGMEPVKVNGREIPRLVSPLPARVLIDLGAMGQIAASGRQEILELAESLEWAEPDSNLLQIVREGTVYDPDTQHALDEASADQVRSMLLGTSLSLGVDVRGDGDDGAPPDYLIEGIWERNSFPQLSGPAKGGKTLLVFDLIFTLLVAGHRFLGTFARGNVTPADLWHGIVVFNTEMSRQKFNRALAPLKAILVQVEDPDGNRSMVTARSLVRVYHLRDLGGPAKANFLRAEIIEEWRRELLLCQECLGFDNEGPLAVIVDNGSAILRAIQKGPIEHSGELFEGWRQLMTEALVESGLWVSHSDKAGTGVFGGVQAAAPSDGEWLYSGFGPGVPRYFSISARTQIGEDMEPTLVTLNDDGWPVLSLGTTRSLTSTAPAYDARAEIVKMLTEASGRALTTGELIGSGGHGQELRPALKELYAEGRVLMEKQGQTMFWSVVPMSGEVGDTDEAAPTAVQ